MGTLYLVRHGQASFGAEDYDQLSALGQRQSVRLGEYLGGKALKFDAVLTGTLRRHAQTWAGIAEGMGLQAQIPNGAGTHGRSAGPPQARPAPSGLSAAAPDVPAHIRTARRATASGAGMSSAAHEVASVGAHIEWPGLNEYDSHAVIEAVHPQPLPKPDSPEGYRHHFRLLRDGLAQWMAGVVSPKGMPEYVDFVHGITSALDHIRHSYTGNVLLVSSGGPIATAVGHILGSPPEKTIELNMRIRNSALTEFAFNPKRHMLLTYNTLPHLDHADYAGWVTYA